jgi:pyrroloquinoline quinone biosynthesis protein D
MVAKAAADQSFIVGRIAFLPLNSGFLLGGCRITRLPKAQTATFGAEFGGQVAESGAIASEAKPRLPRGVRLTHNEAQGGWVLLAPERIFKADAIAVEILKRCTGETTFAAIVDDLATTFNAPRERIQDDVSKLLGGLAEKKLLEF